jgi:F-box/leucine-rich repeat protein 10/11
MASITPRAPRSRSTFKHPPHPSGTFASRSAANASARSSSPVSPEWEPLSPTLSNAALPQSTPSTQPLPPTVSQHPEQPRGHKRSPSAIESLADVALLTSPQLPPAAPSVHPVANHFVTPGPVRGTKRARSDAGPGPQAYSFPPRPSSSHHSHPEIPPLAYNTDRQRRQSTNTTIVTSLEDAELLLNFAGRVASQPPPPDPPRRHAPLGPPAHHANFYTGPQAPPPQPYPYTPAPTHVAHVFIPEPVATLVDPSVTSENASASLPSPQDTNEDEKSMDTDQEISQSAEVHTLPAASVTEPPWVRVPQQTHTPPEEERRTSEQSAAQLPLPTQDTIELPAASVESQQPTDAPAARPRRGWPKGKPRGPRNKNSTTTKPRSSARRSRASTAKSVADSSDSSVEEQRPRRKSDTDLSPPSLNQLQTRSGDARGMTVPPSLRYEILQSATKPAAAPRKPSKEFQETVCASCALTRESTHGELDQWISCNGCQLWFHFDCAGFKNERDVRDVSKFFCKICEPKHGSTTFVRKSSRAHAAVDYAGLNQGILKTSDDNPEHHYIQPIKDGSFTFDPEMFPRMRPELVTREFFETCSSFSEPVVIPAEYNPKLPRQRPVPSSDNGEDTTASFTGTEEEEALLHDFEYETVPDDGQDRLDMVVPRDLTVRHVAELVGPHEPLEVIDVKTQGTEGKWNLSKWADYYEADGEKAVRNVISLEVSSTKLGRLLRRPKVVRDIDLQDSVWPDEETFKGNFPKVQFYCLMSVADSFTDFHIDFGGSSVYYHILRGKKTFFFIPPKPGHLKKYEDWNNSHEQNFTWLPDATKECYRVDLSAGDTMLIPSGWIHAVWTPENSLVIGGNFLTRMHYSTQFRIVDIEKAIKTPQKFRYPHFQKVMWYTVIKYLETDPLPAEVAQVFYSGAKFVRERPVWEEFGQHGVSSNCAPGSAHYNCRYYSQAELDGLPDLINFIFRTVMIGLGRIEGVTEDTRKKVMRSMPKSRGEPLELARTFALWVAWKRGNEDPPAWAHPEADLPDKESAAPKKLGARALKAMQRQEAFEAYRVAPERQSARQNASRESEPAAATSPGPSAPPVSASQTQTTPGPSGQHTSTPKTSVLGPKRVACDACRKRRIKCKHKDVVTTSTPYGQPGVMFQSTPSIDGAADATPFEYQRRDSRDFFAANTVSPVKMPEQIMPIASFAQSLQPTEQNMQTMQNMPITQGLQGLQNGHIGHLAGIAPMAQMTSTDSIGPAAIAGNALLADNSKRGRSKACLDCRKSKVSLSFDLIIDFFTNMYTASLHP